MPRRTVLEFSAADLIAGGDRTGDRGLHPVDRRELDPLPTLRLLPRRPLPRYRRGDRRRVALPGGTARRARLRLVGKVKSRC